jgi:hypothetical protein
MCVIIPLITIVYANRMRLFPSSQSVRLRKLFEHGGSKACRDIRSSGYYISRTVR